MTRTLASDARAVRGPKALGASSYERRFAALVGARHAVAFGYGRTAITALLRPLGTGADGGEVVCSALTCRVVPLAILRAGLVPWFADISLDSLNLDPAGLAARWSPAIRAIVFQHTYGQGRALDQIAEVASARGVPMIEDRAQTLPAAGTPLRGIAALYSNNLVKPLPAGSGGMLVTDDDELAARVRAFRDRLPVPGFFFDARRTAEQLVQDRWLTSRSYWSVYDLHRRLASSKSESLEALLAGEIVAAEVAPTARQERRGLAWLERAGRLSEDRSAAVAAYRERLTGLPGQLLAVADGPLYYYPLLVGDKPGFLREARRRRIEIIAWPIGLPIYPVEREADLLVLGYRMGRCPVAERVGAELVGLPTARGVDHDEVDRVVQLVRDWVARPAGAR